MYTKKGSDRCLHKQTNPFVWNKSLRWFIAKTEHLAKRRSNESKSVFYYLCNLKLIIRLYIILIRLNFTVKTNKNTQIIKNILRFAAQRAVRHLGANGSTKTNSSWIGCCTICSRSKHICLARNGYDIVPLFTPSRDMFVRGERELRVVSQLGITQFKG